MQVSAMQILTMLLDFVQYFWNAKLTYLTSDTSTFHSFSHFTCIVEHDLFLTWDLGLLLSLSNLITMGLSGSICKEVGNLQGKPKSCRKKEQCDAKSAIFHIKYKATFSSSLPVELCCTTSYFQVYAWTYSEKQFQAILHLESSVIRPLFLWTLCSNVSTWYETSQDVSLTAQS